MQQNCTVQRMTVIKELQEILMQLMLMLAGTIKQLMAGDLLLGEALH